MADWQEARDYMFQSYFTPRQALDERIGVARVAEIVQAGQLLAADFCE